MLGRLLTGGAGAVLATVVARGIFKDAKEEKRRKDSPRNYGDGISEAAFNGIVRTQAKRTPRVHDVAINGMTAVLTVRSNSGLTYWYATIDFNDYGHLTGKYWLSSGNSDSPIPEFFADAVRAEIQQRVNPAFAEPQEL